MRLLEVKKIRFAEVVKKYGSPERYTLWQEPKKDATLARLLKSDRLMTIRATEPGKAEFGEVGFHQREGASYLAFSRSLKRVAGNRIIGIKWDLVQS